MRKALRNRVIILALAILVGQLSLVIHATVHDAEFSCQICLTQSSNAKGIPVVKLDIPQPGSQSNAYINVDSQKPVKPFPRAYSQRAPPVFI